MLLLTIVLLIETILSITYLYTLARRIERLEDEISELKTRHTKLLLKG
jgi:cell division protein FtsL